MTKETFTLKARFARRIPDPNFGQLDGMEHHVLLVSVVDLPKDLPLEANARRPNTRKQVYKEVRESLMGRSGEPGTFHLKNKGIVIVAESVKQKPGTNDTFVIDLNRTNQGILDGGHTYQLILDAQGDPELSASQHVFVQIRTGIPSDWVPEISRGLNTSVQVQDMSLDNLAGRFSWIKEELKGRPYYDQIAWSENDPGDFSARDIIALMYLFNTSLFPNSESHPIAGYEKKSEALKRFEENEPTFRIMKPILREILYLHDYISLTAVDLYNRGAAKNGTKGRGGGMKFVKQANRKQFEFPFMENDEVSETELEDAALYPIMAAFRVFVERDGITGKVRWAGGFQAVKEAWKELAYELITSTSHTSKEVSRSINAIGKSRLHWDGLYQKVENFKLRQLAQAS